MQTKPQRFTKKEISPHSFGPLKGVTYSVLNYRRIIMSADGTWTTTINTPMGAQTGTLVLATNGSELSGSMQSPQGEMAIADGKANGDKLSWTTSITSPMPMDLEFSAVVAGDEITGSVKLGAFGNADFKCTRA
jgi:hypothetical protein